jgi:hypothetical protein
LARLPQTSISHQRRRLFLVASKNSSRRRGLLLAAVLLLMPPDAMNGAAAQLSAHHWGRRSSGSRCARRWSSLPGHRRRASAQGNPNRGNVAPVIFVNAVEGGRFKEVDEIAGEP